MKKKAASSVAPQVSTDIPIREIRGQRVLLDSDLAAIYGVPTSALNQAVKRNGPRFPADFMFQLTREESAGLRSQNVILDAEPADREAPASNSSQIAISKPARGQHRKYLPYAFTEHGALQAANVLKSERAVAMSVFVIRAFVQMREELAANATIEKHLAAMDRKLLEHDEALVIIWNNLKPLLAPPREPPKPRIGFKP